MPRQSRSRRMRKRKSKSGERRYRSDLGSGPIGRLSVATFSLDMAYDSGDTHGWMDGWKIVFDETCPWLSEEEATDMFDPPHQIRLFAAQQLCQSLCGLFHWNTLVSRDEIETHRNLRRHSPVFANGPPTIRTKNLRGEWDVDTFLNVLCYALTQCIRAWFSSEFDGTVKWMRSPDNYDIYLQQEARAVSPQHPRPPSAGDDGRTRPEPGTGETEFTNRERYRGTRCAV